MALISPGHLSCRPVEDRNHERADEHGRKRPRYSALSDPRVSHGCPPMAGGSALDILAEAVEQPRCQSECRCQCHHQLGPNFQITNHGGPLHVPEWGVGDCTLFCQAPECRSRDQQVTGGGSAKSPSGTIKGGTRGTGARGGQNAPGLGNAAGVRAFLVPIVLVTINHPRGPLRTRARAGGGLAPLQRRLHKSPDCL